MKTMRVALLLALSMIAVALAAHALRPLPSVRSNAPKFVLTAVVPTVFGEWRVVDNGGGAQIVNPQSQKVLDKLYSQVLTRTYSSADGYLIMLSIAYSSDQTGGMQVHLPEGCYPAQGFTLNDLAKGTIAAPGGPINVTRLEARLGARVEPVTYWLTLADESFGSVSRLERRLAELRLRLGGQMPDGLIFRVSSIDNQRDRAFQRQEQFAADLLSAVDSSGRVHLIGRSQR